MKYAYTGALVTLAASATAQAQEVTIDLTGIGSWDALGAPDNIVLTESLPAGSIVNGVTWTDVTGSGLGGPSWGNEMRMDINGAKSPFNSSQPRAATLLVVSGASLWISRRQFRR